MLNNDDIFWCFNGGIETQKCGSIKLFNYHIKDFAHSSNNGGDYDGPLIFWKFNNISK